MEKYEALKLEVILFEAEDVLTDSGEDLPVTGGN